MSALDRKLQYHEDRCKTQMTAAGRDMPCTCDRDDALAELSALRERVEALEAAGREILDAEAPRILGEDLEDWLKRQRVAFSKFREVVQAP